MLKFKKDFNIRIISLVVAVLFIFNSAVYGIDIPAKSHLRIPVGETDAYKRLTEAIKTWGEQENVIDPNLNAAHKDGRAQPLHKSHLSVIEEAHNFLEANGFNKDEVALFTSLQERAIIEVPGWDKGGLWLVTPNKAEALPDEHASDRGGIHIAAYPDADLARLYVHGLAAYVGLSHGQARALENAFIAWRNEKKPIPEKLKAEFSEGIGKRKNNPLLLTELSKQEKVGEKSQRDYTNFLFSQKKDPHGTYRKLLKKILREAEDTLAYFYTRSDVPEAKSMARDFAENALASIIRRETESNFTIPYLPEGFPTLSQLMDRIADKSSSEQEMFLNKYIRQIVGALLFLEIPVYLRKQWSQDAGAGQKFPLLRDGNTTIVGAMSQSDLQREYEELNRELLRLGEGKTQVAETYKNQPLIKRMKLAEIEKQLEAIRVRMRKIDNQLRPLKGGMHDSAKRFKALQRFLKIYNIDMGAWIDEQASKMSEQDRAGITDALTKIGLGDSQIKPLLSAIILCEIPENIRLEGKGRFASRIGGLIVRTKDGYRILFPKGRLSKELNNTEYLGDLLHEVEELSLIESGMQVDKAHEQAMSVRSSFLNGELIRLTNAAVLSRPQAVELSTAKAAITQSLDKVILFNGEEVTGRLGSFSEIYTTKNKDNIFVVVVENASQKENLERELKGIGLIPDSDDLKVEVLRGPALEDYKAMLNAGEILGDFTIIRGRNIDETRTSLRDTLASI